MRQRDRGSLTDSHPQDLFFDSADDRLRLDDDVYDDDPDGRAGQPGGARRPTRVERRRHVRSTRRRGVAWLFVAVLVAAIAAAAVLIGLPIYHYVHPANYSGAGTGSVVVTVHANDDASQIAATLYRDGVVASTRAFVDAANGNDNSQNIQPGSYRLRSHMSATRALGLLLNPTARVNSDVLIPEGATVVDVEKRLLAPVCTASSPTGTVCGLGLDQASVSKALAAVGRLGLPTDFTVGGKVPTSVEGLLFPATYPFDDSTSATAALQQMVAKFTDQARTTNFTASARTLGITPYQELIIASIAQAEAKFPADMAKVARVLLNRLARGMNLQVDATSAYAAKLRGVDPNDIIFKDTPGAYNTYRHSGLPPTPISNPGNDAMNAAAHPATGNWVFYVNRDAAGHLYFTRSPTAFNRATLRCYEHKWGCAKP